jgi:hypothetical protein
MPLEACQVLTNMSQTRQKGADKDPADQSDPPRGLDGPTPVPSASKLMTPDSSAGCAVVLHA